MVMMTACGKGKDKDKDTTPTSPTVMADGTYALSGVKLAMPGLKIEIDFPELFGFIINILDAIAEDTDGEFCEYCEPTEGVCDECLGLESDCFWCYGTGLCRCQQEGYGPIDDILAILEMIAITVEGNNIILPSFGGVLMADGSDEDDEAGGIEIAYTLSNGVVTLNVDWEELFGTCGECDGCIAEEECEEFAFLDEILNAISIRYVGDTITIGIDISVVLNIFIVSAPEATDGVGEGSSSGTTPMTALLELLEGIDISIILKKAA